MFSFKAIKTCISLQTIWLDNAVHLRIYSHVFLSLYGHTYKSLQRIYVNDANAKQIWKQQINTLYELLVVQWEDK